MKIAYNPVTETALGTAPNTNDIIFDLKGLNIFAKGTKFKGTDTTYSVFKKNTSSSGGGYNGLVPVPSYTTTNVRFLREDGTWWDINNNINNAIDNIEIGGRNLYLNSDKELISTRFLEIKTYDILSDYVGRNVAISFDCKINSGGTSRQLHIYPYQNNGISIEDIIYFTPTTTYKRFKFITKVKDWGIQSELYTKGSIGIYDNAGLNNYSVKNIKIELGNIATDWTPAPEDIENAINKKADKATTLAGYGITDAVTTNTNLTITGTKTFTSNILSVGYVKNGSSDLYVLLGGGGHKLISDFATNSSLGKYLPLTGGTLTGALNFANNIWNKVGDDVAIGDCNSAGILGIKALNAAIPGIKFFNNSGTAIGTLTSNGGTLLWNGVNIFSDFSASNTLTLLTIGGITKSLTIPYSTKAGLLNTSLYSTGSLASLTNSGCLYYAGGSNTVSDKPSGVSAFGLFTMLTADGWHGLILMSSNAATGLYWRTATTFNDGWRTLLDSSNYISYIKKIGTDTVGSTSKGIYLNAGVPTALSANVGASNRPVYMSSGNIVPCSYIFGNASGNAAINNGTLCTNLNADLLDGYQASNLCYSTLYNGDSPKGVLIQTNISATSNTMLSIRITGNSYGAGKVINTYAEAYNYTAGNSIINARAINYGLSILYINIFNYNGVVCLWLPDTIHFASHSVYILSTNDTIGNKVTSITDAEMPSTGVTRLVKIVPALAALLTDNVASATRLQTAHTINGTSFNGTADITTATWGAPRTISLTGAVTGSVSTNGGSNIVINTSYGTGNITSLDSRYVKKTGDTMSGALTLNGKQSGAFNSVGLLFKENSGRIGTSSANDLGIYAGNNIFLRPNSLDEESSTGVVISNSYITYNGSKIWHAGNDGSDSGLDADLLDGKHASSFSLTTHTHSSIKILDNRSTVMLPNNMGTLIVNTFFNMQDNMPTTLWWSGLHFSGWQGNYASWLLAGPAGLGSYSDALYFRSGINSTWNSWKKILFNTDLTWLNILNKPTTFTPEPHEHDHLRSLYTGSGGKIAPTTIGANNAFIRMSSYGNGYLDWIYMNSYGWSDVPYATAIGVSKKAVPAAYIMSGPNSSDTSSWVIRLLATFNDLTWTNILGKPSSFTPTTHTHTISQISDLNENWDTLLKNTPSSYVTRWPSWNEVTNKPTSFTPSTHTHSFITVSDTRSVNGTPASYSGRIIEGEFKTLTSISSPSGLSGTYAGLLTFSPYSDSSGGHIYLMAFGYNSSSIPILHIRSALKDNTTWGSWLKLWHSGNDGSGSGLDADLLDGNHASAFSLKSWWHWSGLSGLPSWLWGGTSENNYYVYNPSNFNVNSASYLRSKGTLNPLTGRTLSLGDVYSYNTGDSNTGAPTMYTSVIGFGRGTGGTVEIAGGWLSSMGLWYRSLRDMTDNWFSWRPILDSTNYTTYVNKIGTASVGNSSTPIFLNKGVPTVCTFRFGGLKNLPVVLFSGIIYKNESDWFYMGHSILDNRVVVVTLNGARMLISISNVTITSAAVHLSTTTSLDGYSIVDIKGRGLGAYWFSVFTNNTNSVYIRPIRLENTENDSWFSSSSAWDNITKLSVTIFGYVN